MVLSNGQLRQLERRLREERVRLERDLARLLADRVSLDDQERAGDLSKIPTHPADLGTDTIEAELDASNADRISRELAAIDGALHRLYHEPERFGVCEDTGRAIPFERLQIVPWARTCEQAGA